MFEARASAFHSASSSMREEVGKEGKVCRTAGEGRAIVLVSVVPAPPSVLASGPQTHGTHVVSLFLIV